MASCVKMTYAAPLEIYKHEKPFYSSIPFTVPGAKQTNFASVTHEVDVQDVRDRVANFNLNEHGFQVVDYPTTFTDWHGGSSVVQEHYPEVHDFLMKELKADKVFIFDHGLRRTQVMSGEHTHKKQYVAPPSRMVHIDQTPDDVKRQIRCDFEPQEADILLGGRYQVINVWRPLFGPLLERPLAVCDYRTLQLHDLVAADLVFPHLISELYNVNFNSGHRWYYLKDQMPDEPWLIKIFDSAANENNEIARCCVHTSFDDPGTPPGARLRESVEVRALVFHKCDS